MIHTITQLRERIINGSKQFRADNDKRTENKVYSSSALWSIRFSNAHKAPYSLLDVAKAIYLKFTTKIAWEKIPLSENYQRSTAYQYWWRKLKDSGKFQEVKNIVRK